MKYMAESVYNRINDYGTSRSPWRRPTTSAPGPTGEVKKPETINYRTLPP